MRLGPRIFIGRHELLLFGNVVQSPCIDCCNVSPPVAMIQSVTEGIECARRQTPAIRYKAPKASMRRAAAAQVKAPRRAQLLGNDQAQCFRCVGAVLVPGLGQTRDVARIDSASAVVVHDGRALLVNDREGIILGNVPGDAANGVQAFDLQSAPGSEVRNHAL